MKPNTNMKGGGGCGCGGPQLGFPQAGGFGLPKMKMKSRKMQRVMGREMNPAQVLATAQANPDGFKTLCGLLSQNGGQELKQKESESGMGAASGMAATAVSMNMPEMSDAGIEGERRGKKMHAQRQVKQMPFPLNLLLNPGIVRSVCTQINENPDILDAPIASEVTTADGATVQDHLNVLHKEAATSGGRRIRGGGIFDGLLGKPDEPAAENIIANNGRTVDEHLVELHNELQGGRRRRSTKKRSTKKRSTKKGRRTK